MENKKFLTATLCSLAVVSGVFGLSVTGVFDENTIQPQFAKSSGMLVGHAIIEAHDSEGNLIAHRATDNEVVNSGENCVLKMLFNEGSPANSGTTVCTGAISDGWRYVGIGTTNTGAAEADVRLGNETRTTTGLERAVGTVTWTNGTGATAASVQVSKTFTMQSGNTHTITESGLFNGTTFNTAGMLARQTFTGVALSDGDSITVTWTFTVGD